MSAEKYQTGSEYCWQLRTLLDGYAVVEPEQDRTVFGLAADSRLVRPGDLFLACRGRYSRGHDYLADAIRSGAVAVVVETPFEIAHTRWNVPLIGVEGLSDKLGALADRFYRSPSAQMFVVGVTGTNGKTSTCNFLAHALSKGESVGCGIIGTLGSGLYGNLTPSQHTTPTAVALQRTLAELRDAGACNAVMEVSSHGIDQGRIDQTQFDVAVFTNLTRDHLDYHGTMDAYVATKRRFMAWSTLHHAVINLDDPYTETMLAAVPERTQALGYTVVAASEWDSMAAQHHGLPVLRACITHYALTGMSLQIESPWGSGVLTTPLFGDFNAGNLLAALAVLLIKGFTLDEAIARLATARPLPGRMEAFGGDHDQPLVIVDYAHTPDALDHVLRTMRQPCRNQLWCVFGCGGDRDRGKRAEMGRIAEARADQVVITDDNPRSEAPTVIVSEILSGFSEPAAAHVIHQRSEAIRFAIEHAQSEDVIVVAGKGHEAYQEIASVRSSFSDRETVATLLTRAPS